MADEVDHGNDRAQKMLDVAIAVARKPLAPGEPGECQRCGEESKRLVSGNCAPCRDRYKLP